MSYLIKTQGLTVQVNKSSVVIINFKVYKKIFLKASISPTNPTRFFLN